MIDPDLQPITAVSPLDGRYHSQTSGLSAAFSEWALIRMRMHVEVEWLILLAERPELSAIRALSFDETQTLRDVVIDFGPTEAARVKEIEQITKHDVKAVEYYLKERLAQTSAADTLEFVHFCCTSEDINNLAYALMLRSAVTDTWLPLADHLTAAVFRLAGDNKCVAMLSRTHGQPASPTTLGKELAVFVSRWKRQIGQIETAEYLGKINGTVGNYHTHTIAYPTAPWQEISRTFVERLGLTWNPLTTQIEPHDYIAEIAHALIRFHNILIGFDQDLWTYISLGYFKQRAIAGEVGSSTMPHKVNPINFENSEANLGISNALLGHLASKLTISRMQRDLSDSSALRNLGSAFGYSIVALQATIRGLAVLDVDHGALQHDLEQNWAVLAEPIQTVMKRVGYESAYEKLKELTRGAHITRTEIHAFVDGLDLPPADKERLMALTPSTYVGIAAELVEKTMPAPDNARSNQSTDL